MVVTMEAAIRLNSWNQGQYDPCPSSVINAPKDIDTLYFPCEITEEIGLSKGRINFLRNLGCRFFGRKTTIRWSANSLPHGQWGCHQLCSFLNVVDAELRVDLVD